MSQHPDLLDLDALRHGGGLPEHADHVRGCAQCAAVLADLEALAAELKQVARGDIAVPAEVERRILWQARKRALALRRSPRVRWRQAAAVAAAAVVVLGLASLLARRADEPASDAQIAMQREAEAPVALPRGVEQDAATAARTEPRAPVAAAVRAASDDVDGDGQVDILDAFALARAVDARRGDRDLDGDGRIDRSDVEVLARRAVSLGGA